MNKDQLNDALWEEQGKFNETATKAFEVLLKNTQDLRKHVERLEKRVADLEYLLNDHLSTDS